MSFEGVWKIEILSPYRWENVATAFMRAGRYHAGSKDHYSIGRYDVEGDNIKISTQLKQFGRKRTIFGLKNMEVMNIRMEGSLDSEGMIVGKVYLSGDDDFAMHVRMTRLGELD